MIAALLLLVQLDAAEFGRRIVEDRALSGCLLCHSGPFPSPH